MANFHEDQIGKAQKVTGYILSALTQSAEKGLDQSGFYGPTGRSYWVGPVGPHKIESHAKDKTVTKKLWERSEKETGVKWNI